jgi:tRNA-specific 2-thiouridylase
VPGPVEDESGALLGEHGGVHRFTVGQRRGLGFAGPGGKPLYVTRIDPARRAVVVGERAAAERRAIEIGDLHWLAGEPPASRLRAFVQVRHRGRPHAAAVELVPGRRARALLDEPAVAAPGQAAVLYDGDTVLGGGWISAPT